MTDQSSVFSQEQAPTKAPEQQAPTQQQEQAPAQQQGQAPQQPTAPSDGVFADQLASIRNERGEPKYKDLPTALEALKHSQDYIPQVKQENESLKSEIERLKAELEQRGSLEETVSRLTARQKEEAQTAPQELHGLTPEQVEELLEQRLNERDQKQVATSNAQSVEQAIIKKYGDKAREVVQAKSQEFGMTVQEMQQWASKNPKAVLALFEVKTSPQGNQAPSSSVNIPPVRPNQEDTLPKPEKSLLRGASTRDLMDYMRKSREITNKRLGVES